MGIGLYRVEVQATVLVPAENEEDAKNAVEALVTHDLPHVQTVERVLAHGVTSADEVAREQMIQHYMALAQDEEWRCDHYDCLCPPEAYEAERRRAAKQALDSAYAEAVEALDALASVKEMDD